MARYYLDESGVPLATTHDEFKLEHTRIHGLVSDRRYPERCIVTGVSERGLESVCVHLQEERSWGEDFGAPFIAYLFDK